VALFTSAPDRRTFFSLLQDAGRNVELATAELDRLMRCWPDGDELRGELKRLEDEGDRITHDILHALYGASFAPLDREDLHALAAALDDVVDYAEETADLLGLYNIDAPMEQALELTGVLNDAGRELSAALAGLDDLDGISAHLEEIHRLEDEGDRISRQALASLFEGGIDPMVVIRWKDVFERLEEAIDACEHVAHVLEGIMLKRS
jgi:predicted phosphate transport protein (TIGR00153 family)